MDQQNTSDISQDLIFDILSNVRRRYVLFHLSRTAQPVPLQELSKQLAAWENDIPVEEVTNKQQKRVYVSLYQTHLPKMEDAGIIEYDDDEGTVAITDRATAVTAYLREEDESEPRWSLYFLLLSVVSTLVIAAVATDVSVFGAVSDQLVSLVIIASFAVLSISYFVWHSRGVQGVLDRYRYGI